MGTLLCRPPRTMDNQSSSAKVLSPRYINRSCMGEISISGFHNPKFLPKDAFGKRLDEGLVTATIQHHLGPLYPGSAENWRGFVGYSLHNPRLFLTLAASDLIAKMPLLRDGNFSDNDLPVNSLEDDERNMIIYSVSDVQRRRSWGCFVEDDDNTNGWTQPQLEQFIAKQWTFSVHIFGPSLFEPDIPCLKPLPYVLLSENSAAGEGHFGKVFKLGLREDHLIRRLDDHHHYMRRVRLSNIVTLYPRDRS